jgi:hypothetical protein
LFEIFDPDLDFTVDENEDDTQKALAFTRLQCSINTFVQTTYDHFVKTKEILEIGGGVESTWEARFTNHYIEQSKLSTVFKDFREVEEIAINKQMLQFNS